jgi:hypothetical protein
MIKSHHHDHLIPRLISAPFAYTIGFFKAAKVPNKKRVVFDESAPKAPGLAARRPSVVENRTDAEGLYK